MCIGLFFRVALLVGAVFLVTKSIAAQGEYAVTHVTIIDPKTAMRQPDMTILIQGSSIVSVGPTRRTHLLESIRVIDATGRFVMPGLWDMHVHFRDAKRDLKMDIANGVLGIRNMGGVAREVFRLRDTIAEGQQFGPKIFACGPIIDGPDSWSNPQFTISVKNADEARAAVLSLKQEGTDCIKVYDGLSRNAYYAIIEEARKLRLPVVGHLPSAISVREASNAGQRSLEHGMVLAGGSTTEKEYIARRVDQSAFKQAMQTKNFSLIPAKITVDETFMLNHFSEKRAQATYALLAKKRTFITPTLVTERALTFIDDLSKDYDSRMQYVSTDELKWWKPENGMLTKYRTREYIDMRKREFAKMLAEVRRAQRLGVRLLAGSDITIPYTYPGFSLHDELKLFVKAGLTPMQALATATVNPALLLGISRKWGRVRRGYLANLVLLNADPSKDIGNIDEIHAVIVNGEFLNRAQLDLMLSEARKTNTAIKPGEN